MASGALGPIGPCVRARARPEVRPALEIAVGHLRLAEAGLVMECPMKHRSVHFRNVKKRRQPHVSFLVEVILIFQDSSRVVRVTSQSNGRESDQCGMWSYYRYKRVTQAKKTLSPSASQYPLNGLI